MQTSDRFPFRAIHTEGSLLTADLHQRVRRASRIPDVRCRVEPQLPLDVNAIYVYLLIS